MIKTNEVELPTTDLECWDKYPKHHWVYDMSRLLDAQNIKWSPLKTDKFNQAELNLKLNIYYEKQDDESTAGYIFIAPPSGVRRLNEVYIVKGEIKLIQHLDPDTLAVSPGTIGEVELRLNAFITLYFQKFTGVICAETYQNNIYRMSLRPLHHIDLNTTTDANKLIKKIYKKHEINAVTTTSHVLELTA